MHSVYLLALISVSMVANANLIIPQARAGLSAAANGSSGCGKKTDLKLGTPQVFTINIQDAKFNFDRTYQINLPPKYDISTPSEILFYFHGQGGQWPWPQWDAVGNDQNFITVQPLGLSENTGVKAWQTGWGTKDRHFADSTCYPSTITTCYDTCNSLGMCSPCAWSTCADDGLFIQTLVQKMKDEFCVDLRHVWANGASNGGMVIYYLTGRFPDMFTKVVPVYGSPQFGTLEVPDALATVDIMHIHDRYDTEVPITGLSYDGWIYIAAETILEQWARLKNCPLQMGFTPTQTPYDGGERQISCGNKVGCTGRVLLCWWDGEHGSWADQTEHLALWFFRLQ